jgi:hypothetical protein
MFCDVLFLFLRVWLLSERKQEGAESARKRRCVWGETGKGGSRGMGCDVLYEKNLFSIKRKGRAFQFGHCRMDPAKKGGMLHYVHSSLIYNSQKLEKEPICPSAEEWIHVIHLHNGVLLSY